MSTVEEKKVVVHAKEKGGKKRVSPKMKDFLPVYRQHGGDCDTVAAHFGMTPSGAKGKIERFKEKLFESLDSEGVEINRAVARLAEVKGTIPDEEFAAREAALDQRIESYNARLLERKAIADRIPDPFTESTGKGRGRRGLTETDALALAAAEFAADELDDEAAS